MKVLLLTLLCTLPMLGQGLHDALRKARWENRVILVHQAPGKDELSKSWNAQILKFKDGLSERDIILLPVDSELSQRYRVPHQQFTLVLIGKDGGEKGRQVNEADLEKFFQLIDKMPMRQREMKEKKSQ